MCHATTLKAEAGGSQVLTGQPRLQSEILFKFKKEKKKKKKSEPWPLRIRQRLHRFNTEDICKIKQMLSLMHENTASSRKAVVLEQNSTTYQFLEEQTMQRRSPETEAAELPGAAFVWLLKSCLCPPPPHKSLPTSKFSKETRFSYISVA